MFLEQVAVWVWPRGCSFLTQVVVQGKQAGPPRGDIGQHIYMPRGWNKDGTFKDSEQGNLHQPACKHQGSAHPASLIPTRESFSWK